MLQELKVAHVVTQDEGRFVEELRGGRHNVYVLAGRICDEAGDALGELREAVFRGDGLPVDGSAGESVLDRVMSVERGRRVLFSRAPMLVNGRVVADPRRGRRVTAAGGGAHAGRGRPALVERLRRRGRAQHPRRRAAAAARPRRSKPSSHAT